MKSLSYDIWLFGSLLHKFEIEGEFVVLFLLFIGNVFAQKGQLLAIGFKRHLLLKRVLDFLSVFGPHLLWLFTFAFTGDDGGHYEEWEKKMSHLFIFKCLRKFCNSDARKKLAVSTHGPLDFPIGLAIFDGLAFIAFLFTTGEGDFHFRPTLFKIEFQGNTT